MERSLILMYFTQLGPPVLFMMLYLAGFAVALAVASKSRAAAAWLAIGMTLLLASQVVGVSWTYLLISVHAGGPLSSVAQIILEPGATPLYAGLVSGFRLVTGAAGTVAAVTAALVGRTEVTL